MPDKPEDAGNANDGRPGFRAVPSPSDASKNLPPPRPVKRQPEAEEPRPRTTRRLTSATRPGITQAMKSAEGDMKAQFVTHKIRSEERANVDVDVNVVYTFVDRQTSRALPGEFQGRLVDISMSGAQVEGMLAADVGRDDLDAGRVILKTRFDLPFVERSIELPCEVTWIKPSSRPRVFLGLKFIDISEEQRRSIRGFLIGLQSPTRSKFRKRQ